MCNIKRNNKSLLPCLLLIRIMVNRPLGHCWSSKPEPTIFGRKVKQPWFRQICPSTDHIECELYGLTRSVINQFMSKKSAFIPRRTFYLYIQAKGKDQCVCFLSQQSSLGIMRTYIVKHVGIMLDTVFF